MLTLNRYGSLADLKKAYDAKKKREKASFGSRLAASCQHLATGTTQKLFNKLTISSKWSFDQMLKCRRSKFKVTLEFSNKISKIQRLSLFGISSSVMIRGWWPWLNIGLNNSEVLIQRSWYRGPDTEVQFTEVHYRSWYRPLKRCWCKPENFRKCIVIRLLSAQIISSPFKTLKNIGRNR